MDEREDEKRLLHQPQHHTLPLTPEGNLDIAGFHLRDADHRRLAVELIMDIIRPLLPPPEVVIRARNAAFASYEEEKERRRKLEVELLLFSGDEDDDGENRGSSSSGVAGEKDHQKTGGGVAAAPSLNVRLDASAGSLSANFDSGILATSVSTSSNVFIHNSSNNNSASKNEEHITKENLRTRTRTVKITHVVDIEKVNVESCFEQIRPFVSQLLLYPECSSAVLQRLGDMFVLFVNAAATQTDCDAIVRTFVKWLSMLLLRYSPELCLEACDRGVVEIKKRADELMMMVVVTTSNNNNVNNNKATSVPFASLIMKPTEICEVIISDVLAHLEDESVYYPAARISLARLMLVLHDPIQNNSNVIVVLSIASTTSNDNNQGQQQLVNEKKNNSNDDDKNKTARQKTVLELLATTPPHLTKSNISVNDGKDSINGNSSNNNHETKSLLVRKSSSTLYRDPTTPPAIILSSTADGNTVTSVFSAARAKHLEQHGSQQTKPSQTSESTNNNTSLVPLALILQNDSIVSTTSSAGNYASDQYINENIITNNNNNISSDSNSTVTPPRPSRTNKNDDQDQSDNSNSNKNSIAKNTSNDNDTSNAVAVNNYTFGSACSNNTGCTSGEVANNITPSSPFLATEGDYYADQTLNFAQHDGSLLVRKIAVGELAKWIDNTDRSRCSCDRAYSRAKIGFDAVSSLEMESRSSHNTNDADNINTVSGGGHQINFVQELSNWNNRNDRDHEGDQQQQQKLNVNCFWHVADTLRFSCIPLLLSVCRLAFDKVSELVVADEKQGAGAPPLSSPLLPTITITTRNTKNNLVSLFFKASSFASEKFPNDFSWRVRHQIATSLADFAKLAFSMSQLLLSTSSSSSSSSSPAVSFTQNNNINNSSGDYSASDFTSLVTRWVFLAKTLAVESEPAIRQAIALRADEIFLETAGDKPSSFKILPTVVMLAQDHDVVVRTAAVKPFFRVWNALTLFKSKEQQQQRQQQLLQKNSDVSVRTAVSPAQLEQYRQIEEREPLEAFCSLLGTAIANTMSATSTSAFPSSSSSGQNSSDEDSAASSTKSIVLTSPVSPVSKTEKRLQRQAQLAVLANEQHQSSVRIVALESLHLLTHLLENREILDSVVAALCSVVPTQIVFQPSSTSSQTTTDSSIQQQQQQQTSLPQNQKFATEFHAGKWQLRKLVAEQIPLLIKYVSYDEFKEKIWPCLGSLLHDPTASVKEQVVEKCLPKVVEHYGSTCALNMVLQWIAPLCGDASYSKRRSGFVALARILDAVPELKDESSKGNLSFASASPKQDQEQQQQLTSSPSPSSSSSSSSPMRKRNGAVTELIEVGKRLYEKIAQDTVSLVRESVEKTVASSNVMKRMKEGGF